MNNAQPIVFDIRKISPELEEILFNTKQAAVLLEERTVSCPICGFRLLEVFGRDHHLTRVKCRKCKFEDIIDTALFRTVVFYPSHRYAECHIPKKESLK